MKLGQTKLQSVAESIFNIFIGVIVNYIANIYILPEFFGVELEFKEYGKLTLIYTAISLIRSFGLRRIFNWYHLQEK